MTDDQTLKNVTASAPDLEQHSEGASRRKFVQAGTILAAGAGLSFHTTAATTGGDLSGDTQEGLDVTNDTLAFKSAGELAAKIAAKEISPSELTQYFIARIEEHNGPLNAVIATDFERAVEFAKELDGKPAVGPFHGVPMTVKESYNVAGLKTTWGNPAWQNMLKSEDAMLVSKFRDAGAVVLGKTNVPFMLGDYQSYNAIYGQTNNPWDVNRGPGGSSGGSAAALAAGLTGIEAGSDIGGSLRNPAHYCGIYAHKPTLGLVPSGGHQPPVVQVSNGVDIAVVGPMARSAADLRTAMSFLPGPMPLQSAGWKVDLPPPRAKKLSELRVAFWHNEVAAEVDSEIVAKSEMIAQVLREAGATVVEDARPQIDVNASMQTFIYLMQAVNMSGVPDELFEQNLKMAQQFSKDDMSIEAMFAKSAVQSHNDWVKYDGHRHMMRHAWNAFFSDIDVLVCPISSTVAFEHDQSEPAPARMLSVNGGPQPMFQQSFWAGIIGVAGLPSTVFPTGLSNAGLPIGLQAVSAEFHDRTAIEFAALMEEAIGGFRAPKGYT